MATLTHGNEGTRVPRSDTIATRSGDRGAPRPRWVGAFVAMFVLASTLALTSAAAPVASALVTWEAHGSVNQVYTFGHTPGDSIELRNGASTLIATGIADSQGAFLFGKYSIAGATPIPAGTGYSVRNATTDETTGGLTVTDPTDHPVQSFYNSIDLGPGVAGTTRYTYIPTRDGTLLSANITFPKDGSSGPWPVLIDYSGYEPSRPPNPPQEAQMYPYAGYVVVGLNLRGTTCSGGAFNLWEPLQTLDGYDAVEALAAQTWSTGHVGLVGISYMGISQLFVAQTQPPHLDAISPLSTYADFYRGIGYPGGIINSGFFLDWLAERDHDSQPASHGWVAARIANGDTVCQKNMVLRMQSQKLIPEAVAGRFYETRGDYLSPATFVNKIKVPTFLVGQFQDEQTGGQWSTMVKNFDPNTKLRVQMTNGTHVEGMGPEHLPRLMEFLDFYVKKKIPKIPATLRLGIPSGLQSLFGDPSPSGPYTVPIDRFSCYMSPRPVFHPDCTGIPVPPADDYAGALASYESEPRIRIYWENGYGPAPRTAGQPFSSAQGDYTSWPLPGTVAQSYYFQPDGSLGATAPTVPDDQPRGASSYAYDPASKNPKRTFTGGSDSIWQPLPAINWKPLAEGNSLSFVSDPFTKKTAFAGTANADLWLRSTELDTDVEVTLTEVRPDGKETFIQSGWLRASHRKLAAGADALNPVHSDLAGDAAPLPAGEFREAQVAIFPFAHVIRPGSRLRINIEVPGGNQAFWQVSPMDPGHAVTNDIAHSIGRASRIIMPLVPDALTPAVPDALPACPGLRGQACRDYLPARTPTGVHAAVSGADLAVAWTPPGTGGMPDSYKVTVAPTGESFTVPGDTTTFTYPGATRGTAFTFRVAAVFGDTTAPASDASLAQVIPVPEPTTTTTSTTSTSTTSTTAMSSTTSTTAGVRFVDRPDVAAATTTSGALPVTGADIGWLAAIAALLLLAGVAVIAVTSRGRASHRS